jgi:hypothetical protein
MAQKKLKAFISLGKIARKNSKGTVKSVDEYIVMAEDQARFIGAKYTTTPPAPRTIRITKGKSAGRSYTKEYAATIDGHVYALGYANGFTGSVPNLKVKIKWVSFYLPRSVNLKLFLSLIYIKTTKQALKLKMPSGVTSNLQGKA